MMALELRHAETDGDIAACFAVLRQLRPSLEDAAELVGRVRRQQEAGYRLLAPGTARAWSERPDTGSRRI